MVRPPCCEKMGVKKGPWTPEEDRILVSYIEQYGHENWRALPKQAGLLRCGKSCRLRWINYLRPDIKRGNFSKEEEETIIKLHEMLGNRWSAIATRLSGRTDNEIKNYWNTHLRKRVKQNQQMKNNLEINLSTDKWRRHDVNESKPETISNKYCSNQKSSQPSKVVTEIQGETSYQFSCDAPSKFQRDEDSRLVFQSPSGFASVHEDDCGSNISNDMYFWYNIFINAGK